MVKTTNLVEHMVKLSEKCVYLLCDKCPTCDKTGRRFVDETRQIVYHHQHTPLAVVMPGNRLWPALYAMWKTSQASDSLPCIYYHGTWFPRPYLLRIELHAEESKK